MAPQPNSELGASREIRLSERELNALIGTNIEFSTLLIVDLADDLASAKILLPMPPDIPLIGGKTVRVHAGLKLAYADADNRVSCLSGLA